MSVKHGRVTGVGRPRSCFYTSGEGAASTLSVRLERPQLATISINSLVCLAALSAAMGLFAREGTTDAYEDVMSNTNMDLAAKWCFEDGHKIMQVKGVGTGDPLSFCGSWQIPQSISHNGVLFCVTNINDECAFELYDAVAQTKINVKLARFENEEIARLRTFVRFGACDLRPESLAELLTVSNITSNALFVDDPKNSSPNAFLVYKNLSLNLIAATNRLELALALLNAGLPEGERLNVGQHNVPICEGDR